MSYCWAQQAATNMTWENIFEHFVFIAFSTTDPRRSATFNVRCFYDVQSGGALSASYLPEMVLLLLLSEERCSLGTWSPEN